MEPYTLLTIARSQSLATELMGALDPTQYLIRWVPCAAQAQRPDFCPSLVILAVPPSGGARSSRQIKDRFAVPLVGLIPPDLPPPEAVDESLQRPFRMKQLVGLIEDTLLAFAPHVVHAPGISLDTRTKLLRVDDASYQLRPTGCRIMAELMAQPDCVVPRDELIDKALLADPGDGSRALDVHISHLRRQLEADPRHPELLVTERGAGYKLRPPGCAT
ncbi:winged helix-turn-helix domain-containing protein [Chloroflexota bacterium]